MGAPKLTVEQLDARHAEKRAALQARHEEAEKAKAEREAEKAGKRKLEILEAFLDRHGLSLKGGCEPYVDDPTAIEVFWNDNSIGTLMTRS